MSVDVKEVTYDCSLQLVVSVEHISELTLG